MDEDAGAKPLLALTSLLGVDPAVEPPLRSMTVGRGLTFASFGVAGFEVPSEGSNVWPPAITIGRGASDQLPNLVLPRSDLQLSTIF